MLEGMLKPIGEKNATTLKILNIKIKLVAGTIPFDPRFLFSLSLPYNSLPYNTPSPPYQMISLMSTNIWNHPGLWLVKLLSSTPVVLELTWKVKIWAFCWGNSPRIIMLKSYIVFGVYIIWNVYIYIYEIYQPVSDSEKTTSTPPANIVLGAPQCGFHQPVIA